MCVIFSVEETRPTEEMIDKAWERNGDGGGIAWRQKNAKGEVEVHWIKGIKEIKKMKELCASTALPYVAHFRKSSPQFVVTQELTHPFPVSHKCELWLKGYTKGYVLFHNGSWGDWERDCKEAALKSGVHIPPGRWSDTRAMAWLSSIFGIGWMEFMRDQKGVAFGPDDEYYYTGKGGADGWKEINGVWCSNDLFTLARVGNTTQGGAWTRKNNEVYCKHPQCVVVSPLDQHGYCPKHPKLESGGTPTNVTPFRQESQGTCISLGLAERLHERMKQDGSGERVISRSKMKDIRKCYSDIAVGGKKEVRAREKLLEITRKLLSNAGSKSVMTETTH